MPLAPCRIPALAPRPRHQSGTSGPAQLVLAEHQAGLTVGHLAPQLGVSSDPAGALRKALAAVGAAVTHGGVDATRENVVRVAVEANGAVGPAGSNESLPGGIVTRQQADDLENVDTFAGRLIRTVLRRLNVHMH